MDTAPYTFYYEGGCHGLRRSAMPLFDIACCSSDEDAKAVALTLLARKDAQDVVEVWVDNYPIMKVSREPSCK